MMVTNGEPSSYGDFSHPLASTATWNECVQYCYDLGSCVAVFDNNCQMFEIGGIETAKRNETSRIAIKILMDNSTTETCPADDSGTEEGIYITNTTYQNYSISYNDPTWTFVSQTLTCPTNFSLFVRPNGLWCMQVIEHYACCNRTVAIKMCSTNYSASQLSGVDNQAEYDYISALTIPIYQNVMSNRIGNVTYNFTGIWLDGLRNSSCTGVTTSPCNTISAFSFLDPTLSYPPQGYPWLSGNPNGLTSPGDAIALRVNTESTYGMDDTA
ncbi:hypothetical protein GCK72_001655 [Caenorhabditis remanei]|uniref:PAN-3 domain-containing protein n=1 Tax=Caenorhabditis remanei TaxID=31234 RepID=A0A6A5HPJ5_CAERE|nr:hypothetical protein GCK72_001655 [Caenorhabditis remanei]KAF1769838.1 hypothetical protein GCK72_001655 [Caenorhabditis remanei]